MNGETRESLPELLAPAGNMERLEAALRFGADAVYVGAETMSLRNYADNFTAEGLKAACEYAHTRGKRVYVACNAFARDADIRALPPLLKEFRAAGADALIVNDPGVVHVARDVVPELPLHLSTQANTLNAEAALFWHEAGIRRIVLARELSLAEIKAMRAALPDTLELEIFVHGAMCVSYSGRCLLSNYIAGRDSNRGACAQPCRYQYALMEEKRPGEYFPVYEDEKGTYILNSRDMCMIDHLKDLMDAGVDCIKIEGRAKSAYYAAIVTGAYRHCIDDAAAGRETDPVWRDEVDHVSHRIYSTGFYYGEPGQYVENSRYIRQWQIVAKVESCDENGLAVCSLNNKFRSGDALEVVGPDLRPFPIVAEVMADMEGMPLDEPRTPQMLFTLQLPRQVPPLSMLRRSVDLSAK